MNEAQTYRGMLKIEAIAPLKEVCIIMESTDQYLNKLHDTQAKDEKNRRAQGKGTPSSKLPTKQHSNNP
ncbi:hypothetical protein MALU111345_14150 [Marinicrinis lubricantis]